MNPSGPHGVRSIDHYRRVGPTRCVERTEKHMPPVAFARDGVTSA